MIMFNEKTGCNEAINATNFVKEEKPSLMHSELKTIRNRIDVLNLSLEEVIDVLSGGTITKFKKSNNNESVEGVVPVLEPENMTLGDNLTHLEIMVNSAIQRVEEIENIIGMRPESVTIYN